MIMDVLTRLVPAAMAPLHWLSRSALAAPCAATRDDEQAVSMDTDGLHRLKVYDRRPAATERLAPVEVQGVTPPRCLMLTLL